MDDWNNIDRHLGPSEDAPPPFAPQTPQAAPAQAFEASGFAVPTPIQAQGAPASSPIIEPLHRPLAVLPAVAPATPPASAEEWTAEDEFDPRFCTVCHKKVPHIVSERQEMCDECLAKHGVGMQPLPVTGTPIGDTTTPAVNCPMCGGTNVEREWRNDWISTAVDIVADATSLGMAILTTSTAYRYGRVANVSPNTEIGRVKVMRHRCLTCGHKWVE